MTPDQFTELMESLHHIQNAIAYCTIALIIVIALGTFGNR